VRPCLAVSPLNGWGFQLPKGRLAPSDHSPATTPRFERVNHTLACSSSAAESVLGSCESLRSTWSRQAPFKTFILMDKAAGSTGGFALILTNHLEQFCIPKTGREWPDKWMAPLAGYTEPKLKNNKTQFPYPYPNPAGSLLSPEASTYPSLRPSPNNDIGSLRYSRQSIEILGANDIRDFMRDLPSLRWHMPSRLCGCQE
jgi:hypothetical protein